MPKKIVIDGIIGWDVYGSTIRRAFDEAGGEEIEIELASPGGFAYDALEIFNIINDYAKNIAPVTFIIQGLAASSASYVALAGTKVKAKDNAAFMIHNAWSFMIGDYHDMRETADHLEGLTNLLAKNYAKKSGKTLSEIRKLMDAETWYWGDEAKDAGFVDEIIETIEKDNDQNSKKDSIALAKSRVQNMYAKMQESEKAKKDLSRAAALIPQNKKQGIPAEEKEKIKNNFQKYLDRYNEEKKDEKQEVKIMPKLNELLSGNPEAKKEYDENIQAAKDSGIKEMQDRIDAVTPFLANENYKGQKIQELAKNVLSGKADISAFQGAIAAYDMIVEEQKSQAAKKETDEQGDTHPDAQQVSGDGTIKSLADIKAEIARDKGEGGNK